MKPSDFVSTSGQRQDMSQSMLQTEMTDAVNSGIVDRADKSEKSLKSGLYTVGKRASTGGAASAALSAVTSGRKGKTSKSNAASSLAHGAVHGALEGSELEGADDLYNTGKGAYRASRAISRRINGKAGSPDIKNTIKGVGKSVVSGSARSAIQDTELDGADSVYDGSRTGYHIVRGVRKRLNGTNPLASNKSLGKLSEKKSAKQAANSVESNRKAQAASYFKKSVYASNANVQATGATVTSAKSIGVGTAAATGGKSGLLITLSAASPAIIIAVLFILLVLAILTGISGEKANESNVGSLEGVPAEVATYLKGYGYTNEAIAGILGNMQQESSMNPGTSGDDGYGTDSIGLIQLTGSNKNRFLSWCVKNGKTWWNVSAQMEWSFSGEPGTGYYINDWYTNLAEAPSYYRLERGYEPRFESDFYRSGEEIKGSTDVDLVTYSWMACHERCGSAVSYGDDVSRLHKRLEYAHSFLSQLRSGTVTGGQDYESAEQWQKDIVNACHQTGWPGANLCATWTTRVYAAAGYTVYGNGNSVLGHQGYGASYYPSRATTDLSQIQVGMLVSAQFGSNTAAGNAYGHVGIYIGDGMVMDSVSSGIRTIALSDWVSQNGRGWVVCGYPWDWR